MTNYRPGRLNRTPAEIASDLTDDEREVFLAYNFAPGFNAAPKMSVSGGRLMRQGCILSRLAGRDRLFTKRYEKANGLHWFQQTELAEKVRDVLTHNPCADIEIPSRKLATGT